MGSGSEYSTPVAGPRESITVIINTHQFQSAMRIAVLASCSIDLYAPSIFACLEGAMAQGTGWQKCDKGSY